MLKEIGLIGLGVMGKNIALNLSDNGVIIKAFNNSEKKLNDIKKEFKNDFIPFDNLEQFVENLEDPKTILLMVPSGQATKEVIEKLVEIGDARAVKPLITLAKKRATFTSVSAVQALGNFNNKESIDFLITLLTDKDRDIRLEAVEALDKLGWEPE